MRICERKGSITSKRNSLSRGGQGQRGCIRRALHACLSFGSLGETIKINIFSQKACIIFNGCFKIGMFLGLDQTQMTLGQCQISATGQGSKDLYTCLFHAAPRKTLMARTGNTVQDHTCQVEFRRVGLKSQCRRRR